MELISAEALLARLGDPDLRIADVRWYLGEPDRGRGRYEAAHIPTAIFLDLDGDLSAPSGPGRHPLPEPAEFAARLGQLGIGNEHAVVLYDDGPGTIAARPWWMLDNLGHPNVALLDGGLAAWTAAGGPTTTDMPSYPPAHLDLRGAWSKVIDRETLRSRLGDVVLLDLRAPERYRGEVEPVDRIPGHIPTARNMPAATSLGEDGRFLDPGTLAGHLRGLGAGSRPTVVYCGSGVNACHGVLAARLAGLPDPILYPGSYSDWTRSGLPIQTGSDPGHR